MNTESKPEEETPKNTFHPNTPDENEVENALDFLKENGVAIVVGAVLVVAAFIGYSTWQNSKEAKQETASTMLANSQTAPQFQEIIDNYGDTKAAPLAYLSLGAAYFDQGQYDLARQTFNQFKANFPEHDLLPNAVLGDAQALESLGSLNEALAAYENYLKTYPEHYLLPTATFGKARVLEASGQFDDARAVYEDFIAANPDSRWVIRAETGLDFVNKQQRAVQNVMSQAPALAPLVESPVVVPEAVTTP